MRNLSSKEEETVGHVLILNEQVHGIEMKVEKLKENVELMHQDSMHKYVVLSVSKSTSIHIQCKQSVLAFIA